MMRKEISDFLDIIILKIFSAKIDSFEFHDLDLGAKMYRQPIFSREFSQPHCFYGLKDSRKFHGIPFEKKENSICILSLKMRQE